MSYKAYRRRLILKTYELQLRRFLPRYNPTQPIVILLPGGMGSQLDRSERHYPAEPNSIDDTVWLDAGLAIAHDAQKLRVVSNAADTEADDGSYVICGNGPMHFLSMTPYDEFIDFAQNQGWNVIVFGYDWRRPLQEAAALLRRFVDDFRAMVKDAKYADPIPRINLVAHSMGGMVATLALRDAQFGQLPFHSVVTVGTPFYGTATHQDRYYIGERLLNLFYGAELVADIIATLPGPYSLMFLPKAVYDRDAARITDLDKYPLIDLSTGQPADPFDPKFKPRWRPIVRDHFRHITANRRVMVELTAPLDQSVRQRFFNVRATKTRTANYLLWQDVDGDVFSPGSLQSPLNPVPGPGDGTVPFWSAFHAYSSPNNRHTLKYAKDHGTLFEHEEVIKLIASVVLQRKLPARVSKSLQRGPAVASLSRTQQVLNRALARDKKRMPLPAELFAPEIARGVFSQLIW